jgi:hypothetical protein
MSAHRMVEQDEPLMIAWNAYKATDEYANSRKWARNYEHIDGVLWALFSAGHASRDAEVAELQARDEDVHRLGYVVLDKGKHRTKPKGALK